MMVVNLEKTSDMLMENHVMNGGSVNSEIFSKLCLKGSKIISLDLFVRTNLEEFSINSSLHYSISEIDEDRNYFLIDTQKVLLKPTVTKLNQLIY